MNKIINLENIEFKYDGKEENEFVLRNVNLSVDRGEFIVVTGPSGCGKTSLMRCINGLIPHYFEGELKGDCFLSGASVRDLDRGTLGQKVGSVFQDTKSQFFTSTVKDELAFVAENYGYPKDKILNIIHQVTEAFSLEHVLDKPVEHLSGGEKQKVLVAAAQVGNPEIFVFDEPSANLDLKTTEVLKKILFKLKKEKKTIVIAEHRLYYLMEIADRIIYFNNGKIENEWTREDFSKLEHQKIIDLGLRNPKLDFCSKPREKKCLVSNIEKEVLRVEDLVIGFSKKKPLSKEINFSLKKGEVIALGGANGIGKSTLVKVIAGLKKEYSGNLFYHGEKIKKSSRVKRMWYVLQESDYQLFSNTVKGELFIKKNNIEGSEELGDYLLEKLGLAALSEEHPATLSGGQKQRLTFAVGLMTHPEILILDEPTSGLDGRNLKEMVKIIKKFSKEGITVLIVTHDHELIESVCDRLLIMSESGVSENFVNKESINQLFLF